MIRIAETIYCKAAVNGVSTPPNNLMELDEKDPTVRKIKTPTIIVALT
jgi:hypothetical protein